MAFSKNYTTDYWLPLFDRYASDLPRERLAAWVSEETGGFPQGLGACTEVGIFQIDLQDGPRYGGTTATLHANFCSAPCVAKRIRDLTDDEEQLQVESGAAMVREYLADSQSRLDAAGLTWSDDDTWCFCKLHHGLPSLKYLLARAASAGQAADWPSFRSYALGLDSDGITATAGANTVRYMPLTRFFDNAESVGYTSFGGLSGGGGLSTLGKAVIALALMLGVMYYGGRYGIAV